MKESVSLSSVKYSEAKELNSKQLEWNVFVHDINARKIVVENVFDYNWVFLDNLYKINKDKTIDTFEKFSEAVRRALMSEYWCRSEYETIVTTWPPYVDSEEIDRLVAERKEDTEKFGHFYCTDVRLELDVKIDVYTQIMLNWNHFIKYVWDNRKLIKKVK